MTTTNPKYINRIASECVSRAQAVLGRGWDHVGIELRRGLAMVEVIGCLRNQDDSISSDKVRANTLAIADAVDALIGWK